VRFAVSTTILALCLLALMIASPVAAQSTVTVLTGPNVPLSTYYGGSGNECITDRCKVAVDAQGYIYIVGTTSSPTFPVVKPLFTRNSGAFVVKLAPDGGSVVYSTYIATGSGFGIAADAAGRAYVTGFTADNAFPLTPNALKSTRGGVEAFLAVLSPDGQQLVYGSYLGGSGTDEGYDVDVDAAGNIYLAGYTESADFPVKNARQSTFGGSRDGFVMRINADFTLGYSTFMGGSGDDRFWALAVDQGGSAFVTGLSNSNNFPVTPGALQTVRYSGAGSDAVIARFGADGGLIYSTFYNQSSSNPGVDIATDGSGVAYVLTRYEGLLRLNPSGSALTYQVKPALETDVSGEGGIAVDSAGNAYAVGRSGPSANKDVKFVIVSPTGRVLAERVWGGAGEDWASGLAVRTLSGCAATAFIAGTSLSTNYPTTPGSVQPASGGGADAFLTVLHPLPSCTVHLPLIRH
jgi:hypothetical protein